MGSLLCPLFYFLCSNLKANPVYYGRFSPDSGRKINLKYPNLVQSRIFCVLRKTRAINGGEKTRKGVGRQKTEEKGETRSLGKKDLGINQADALPLSSSPSLRRGKRPFVPRRPPHVSYKTARRREQALQSAENGSRHDILY